MCLTVVLCVHLILLTDFIDSFNVHEVQFFFNIIPKIAQNIMSILLQINND